MVERTGSCNRNSNCMTRQHEQALMSAVSASFEALYTMSAVVMNSNTESGTKCHCFLLAGPCRYQLEYDPDASTPHAPVVAPAASHAASAAAQPAAAAAQLAPATSHKRRQVGTTGHSMDSWLPWGMFCGILPWLGHSTRPWQCSHSVLVDRWTAPVHYPAINKHCS